MDRQYVYKITAVVKVSDGDTYHLKVDAGFHHEVFITCRLMGYDCPERQRGSDVEKAAAKQATAAAAWWFTDEPDVARWVRTEKDPDSFGRWLGHIWAGDDDVTDTLGGFLHQQRLASVWPTRWRDEFDRAESSGKHSTTCDLLVSNRACTCGVGVA